MENNYIIKEDLVRFLYDIGKGDYIKDVYYEIETERTVKFKRKLDNKYCSIPKSFIQNRWKKDNNIPQNIYIQSYLTLLRICWEKHGELD